MIKNMMYSLFTRVAVRAKMGTDKNIMQIRREINLSGRIL